MYIFRLLLAAMLISSAFAAQAEIKVSIGNCGDADILLAFKGVPSKHL